MGGLALAYAALTWLILTYFTTDGDISVVWIPSGLGVAIVLLLGTRYWPAIFGGAMLAYLVVGRAFWPSLFIAASNVIEPLLVAWVLQRMGRFSKRLDTPPDFFKLMLAGALSAALAAALGVMTLTAFGIVPPANSPHGLLQWWMGNLLGITLGAPLLLVWRGWPRRWFESPRRRLETVLFLTTSVLASQILFGDWLHGAEVPRSYLMFLFVSWGALRFGRRGATLIVLLAAGHGLFGALHGYGVFAADLQQTQLGNFWLYIMTLGFVGITLATTINAMFRNEETIQRQAHYDELTQLPNRRLFRDRLQQMMRQVLRHGGALSLLLIDLDRFKEVNDTLGHNAGDDLLVDAARRIRGCIRDTDTVARMGGDEFVVILGDLTDHAGIERVAQSILDRLTEPFMLGTEQVYVSASIGIALYPDDAADIETLLKHADQAMYVSKGLGRNCYSYFTGEMQQQAQKRLRLTNDLRGALARQELRVYYQPIVELATGKIHKAEALLRWQHPTRGLVNPVDFIPLAEESGMIGAIGDWVFRQAANQCKLLKLQYDASFQISVNKSPAQFRNDEPRAQQWLKLLDELGLAGQGITIEITEGLLLDAGDTVQTRITALREAGMQVAIDDFGTGYSSLSYLKKFDIDHLKIDRSFVSNLEHNPDDLALCEAIIVMAHKLGLKVIAEGVETPLQRDMLQAAGCDFAQGFLFSRPVPADQFEALLHDGKTK